MATQRLRLCEVPIWHLVALCTMKLPLVLIARHLLFWHTYQKHVATPHSRCWWMRNFELPPDFAGPLDNAQCFASTYSNKQATRGIFYNPAYNIRLSKWSFRQRLTHAEVAESNFGFSQHVFVVRWFTNYKSIVLFVTTLTLPQQKHFCSIAT